MSYPAKASQEHLKKLPSKLAPMTLNVVNDHVPIFKTTSWLDVQLRNMMGHLAEFGFKAEYQKNLITCGCVWHNRWFCNLNLGPGLSKEATDFTSEGDSILVLESSDRVDEHLDKIRLVKLVILI